MSTPAVMQLPDGRSFVRELLQRMSNSVLSRAAGGQQSRGNCVDALTFKFDFVFHSKGHRRNHWPSLLQILNAIYVTFYLNGTGRE